MPPPILAPIDQSAVSFTGDGPEFEALVRDTLGDYASDADGWEADMQAAVSTFDAVTAALDAADVEYSRLVETAALLDGIDTDSLALDFAGSVPALDRFLGDAMLHAVEAINLPAPITPPSEPGTVQVPTICVPVSQPAPEPTPPRPGGGGIAPPPVPRPITSNCPAGTVWNPVTQACEPCGPGYYFAPGTGDCQPNPPPPPPPPDGTPPPAPPIPIPIPCPTGSVWNPSTGQCVPIEGTNFGPGIASVFNVLIQTSVTQSAADYAVASYALSSIAAPALGLTAQIITMIPVFGAVVGAFLMFNSLFGGSWDEQMQQWIDYMKAWAAVQPVAVAAFAVKQQLADAQQQLAGFPGGQYQRQQLIDLIARLQTRLNGLQDCMAAGNFTTCPGYM